MASKCARPECGKTVYPMEELKCLDKIWHKLCFKCTSCGMALNMKTYKGYDKNPYCEAHYPKTVASVVTDTPEMLRLAGNSKFQSQVNYHADYEKMKGTKMEVMDDPEMNRHRLNAKSQSLVQYHGELEKKNAQESNRPKEELTSNVPSSTSTTFSSTVRYSNNSNGENENSYAVGNGSAHHQSHPSESNGLPQTVSCEAYRAQTSDGNKDASPYTQRLANQAGTVVYSSENGGRVPAEQRQVGSIADYDPLNGDWGTSAASKNAEKTAAAAATQREEKTSTAQPKASAGAQKSSPSKASTTSAPAAQAPAQKSVPTGFTVKALYDYTAADKDEVSFKENDVIVNCANVDEGWMTGTVQRTLTWGMLPANYVEKVNQPTGLFKLN